MKKTVVRLIYYFIPASHGLTIGATHRRAIQHGANTPQQGDYLYFTYSLLGDNNEDSVTAKW